VKYVQHTATTTFAFVLSVLLILRLKKNVADLQVPKSCTDIDLTFLYVAMLRTLSNSYGKMKC